jgi:hypothetical protein
MTDGETNIPNGGTVSAGEMPLNAISRIKAKNAAMQFRIETAGGTSIDGWIPANTSIEIFNGGDITKCDITIPKQPSGLASAEDEPKES